VDTGFIERRLDALTARTFNDATTLAAVSERLEAFMYADENGGVWDSAPSGLLGFRMNAPRAAMDLPMSVDGRAVPLRVALTGTGQDWAWDIAIDGEVPTDDIYTLPTTYGDDPVYVFEAGDVREFSFASAAHDRAEAVSDGAILSPMPGKVVSVSVKAGDTVSKGQTLLVLEAMKMEHALAAPFDGVVAELTAVAGGQVSEGVVLVRLEASEGLGTRG
jgi:propionyl-CoA carboxylase alpha chain/3-methylcrotonyl-CoA carboxylase alpha subunit